MNIKAFRESRNLGQAEIAATLKKWYPGMDASLISKVERPQTYAVQLIPEAEFELADAYHLERPAAVRTRDHHKMTGRIYARMTEEKKHELLTAFKADGFKDVNQGINHLINEYLSERK